MTDSFTSLNYHLIWGTKGRVGHLNEQLQEDLYEYMGGIIHDMNGYPVLINGTSNHVHLLVELHSSTSVSDAVKRIKTSSSAWINDGRPNTKSSFRWQSGYGAFSVSKSKISEVYNYIDHQEQHHETLSFADEFQSFLERNGLDFNEKYLSWDD